ncbi:MAG: 6-phospho-beta-glucosidase [Actinomycetaceae bacterium]|nr:6-phospho-beta-glucosidase [Actinomycetaceae bacterium]
MKLTILGGGGFRTPLVYEAIASQIVDVVVDDVCLYDVDKTRLQVIERVIHQMAERFGENPPRLVVTTNLEEAIAGADFIFAAIRVGGTKERTVDERIALKHGILGQETIGPGGLAYALRTIPVMTAIAQKIQQLAPNAWVINFTNPAGIVTQAMQRVLGNRVVGICDTPIGLVKRVAKLFDSKVSDVSYDYVGINHFGWLRSVNIDGQDVLPSLLASDSMLANIEEARLLGFDYVRHVNALPNEYLYYYVHTHDALRRILDKGETRGEFLKDQQEQFYQQALLDNDPLDLWRSVLHTREATYMAEGRDEERREEDVAGGGYQEVALQLMAAIAHNTSERMILNVANGSGANGRVIEQLPDELTIEVPVLVDSSGVHPLDIAPLTLAQLGGIAALRASEELILEAALSGNPELAWRGFASHPLVKSLDLGAQLLADYRASSPEISALFAAE